MNFTLKWKKCIWYEIKAILNNYNYFKLHLHFQVLVNFIFESLYFPFWQESLYFWSFIIINYGKQKGSNTWWLVSLTHILELSFSYTSKSKYRLCVRLKKARLLKYLNIMGKIWYIDIHNMLLIWNWINVM